MVSRQDVEKRRAWEVRFERFQASGLSVARFCEQERVSVHTFYYWAKRVGSSSARPSTSAAGNPPRRSRPSVNLAATAGGITSTALVRFSWNSGVEVSVYSSRRRIVPAVFEVLSAFHGGGRLQ